MSVRPFIESSNANSPRRFTDLLPPDLFEEVASIGRIRRIPAKSHVCHEGEPVDSFCVIRKGLFQVLLSASDGRSVVLGYISSGEYFGEAMIDGGNRMASVVSCGRGELVCLTRAQFLSLMAERPDFAKHILIKMARMLRATMRFAKRLALLEVEDRVKLLLIEIAEEREGQLVVRPRPSQQAIADRVGASRSMIHRVMKQLEAHEFIVAQGNGLLLRNPPQDG
ncbi:MAG: Crp/Fnr family transcriptional regulator [Burkholderiaceae bacterium]|nr:Crp/Fnr family transcriptional regulator [Burkholderiaceae bacterium]